jgi:hypothetical protein
MTTVADSRRTAPARPILNETMQPKRRWSLLVGGLLLVLLCAGVFAAVQLRAEARVQVLAVARPVAAGQVLVAADVKPVIVAAAFKAGRVPAGLAAGSRVLIVPVDKDPLSGSSDKSPDVKPVPATAVDVAPGPDGSGTTTVSLLVDRDAATTLAATGSDLALVLVGG